MSIKKSFITAAVAGIIALAAATAIAEDNDDYVHMEKCYGIPKPVKAECKPTDGSCKNKDETDDGSVLVPQGTCVSQGGKTAEVKE